MVAEKQSVTIPFFVGKKEHLMQARVKVGALVRLCAGQGWKTLNLSISGCEYSG